MENFKAIFFDMDGVLADTGRYYRQALKQLADEDGVASFSDVLKSGRYTDGEKVKLVDKLNTYYRKNLSSLTESDITEAVMDTLERLESEYLLAVATADRNAGLILERLGLDDFFDVVSDGNNVRRSFPDPEILQRAAKRLAVRPSETLFVTFSKDGVSAAAKGGFISASSCEGAKYKIERVEDILKL